MSRSFYSSALLLGIAACAGPEPDVQAKDPAALLASATSMGSLACGAFAPAAIENTETILAWDLDLSALEADTFVVETGKARATSSEVDTVVYLFSRTIGSESWDFVAKNDDYEDSVFSAIGAGFDRTKQYRVVVTPSSAVLLGEFDVALACGADDVTTGDDDSPTEDDTVDGDSDDHGGACEERWMACETSYWDSETSCTTCDGVTRCWRNDGSHVCDVHGCCCDDGTNCYYDPLSDSDGHTPGPVDDVYSPDVECNLYGLCCPMDGGPCYYDEHQAVYDCSEDIPADALASYSLADLSALEQGCCAAARPLGVCARTLEEFGRRYGFYSPSLMQYIWSPVGDLDWPADHDRSVPVASIFDPPEDADSPRACTSMPTSALSNDELVSRLRAIEEPDMDVLADEIAERAPAGGWLAFTRLIDCGYGFFPIYLLARVRDGGVQTMWFAQW